MRSLSELADSHSVKQDDSVVIDRGSTAGGPHLNRGELRRAERLRRYARLRSYFVDNTHG